MLSFVSVNFLAVIVATVLTMIIGFLWYSPMLFMKPWAAMTPGVSKRTKEQMQERMVPAIVTSALCNLVMAYVLAVIMRYAGVHTFLGGLVSGLWVGVGFVVTSELQNAMYAWKPLKLVAIDAGYVVVSLVVMGAVIGAM